jgi:hypothetical protein
MDLGKLLGALDGLDQVADRARAAGLALVGPDS